MDMCVGDNMAEDNFDQVPGRKKEKGPARSEVDKEKWKSDDAVESNSLRRNKLANMAQSD